MFRLAARVFHPQVSHRCFAVFRFLNKGTATAAAAVRHRTMQSTTFSSSYSSPPSLFSSATTRAAAATSRRVSSRSSNHSGGSGGGGRGAAVMLAAGSFIGWAKKVTNFQDEEDEDDEKERPPTPVLQAMLDAEKALAKDDLHGAEANYQLALDRMREHDPGAEVVVVLHDRLANIYHFQVGCRLLCRRASCYCNWDAVKRLVLLHQLPLRRRGLVHPPMSFRGCTLSVPIYADVCTVPSSYRRTCSTGGTWRLYNTKRWQRECPTTGGNQPTRR